MKLIKIILLCCAISIISCRKVQVQPDPNTQLTKDIFTVSEITVTNGQELRFNLKNGGIYTLIIFDSVGQQVLSREKIVGKIGQNSINLYTKTLPVRYLYLSLEDENNALIGKTKVAIN